MIPLFDSLAHPTVTGRWPSSNRDASVEKLIEAMSKNGFERACAVGLPGLEDYSHEAFARLVEPHENLIPIAGVDPRTADAAEFDRIVGLGFVGVKFHQRLSRFSFADSEFTDALRLAHERNLVAFICTYYHAPIEGYPARDPLFDLATALKAVPQCRVVLVHGGDVELLRYVQLARHSPSILIDLSHTLLKYRGSSLDLDIAYLLEHFNHRICIGVDHPDFSHVELREWFDSATRHLSEDARYRVGYENLATFLGAEDRSAT